MDEQHSLSRSGLPAIGDRLADFEIVGVLGQGATGTVYEARWGPRVVALKIFNPDRPDAERQQQRFLLEAERLAAIAHPRVVKVLSVGSLPSGQPYLVMERLSGESAAARMARGPMPWSQARVIFEHIAEAVGALHQTGLLHRDLKPENVFLIEDGRHAVLLDMGIAKAIDTPEVAVTADNVVVGTPAYMAPERLFGRDASVRSDVYELALFLYAILAGALPWAEHVSPAERLQPRLLNELVRGVPAHVALALADALSADVSRRPESVAELSKRLLGEADTPSGLSLEPAALATAATELMSMPASTASPQIAETEPRRATAAPTRRGRTAKLRRWIGRRRYLALVLVSTLAVGGAVLYFAFSSGVSDAVRIEPMVLLRQQCDSGDGEACYRLGQKMSDGDGVFKDDDLAASMFSRACELSKGPWGCEEIGLVLVERSSHQRQGARALEDACMAGKGLACNKLARLHSRGEIVTADRKKAAELDRRGCRADDAECCNSLGHAHLEGEVMPRDEARAAELFEKSCTLGSALGCFNLGFVVRNGKGIARDLPRARALYQQACEQKIASACTNLGRMYEVGDGGATDLLRAASTYQVGCELGSGLGCSLLAVMYQQGRGVSSSEIEARRYLGLGCELDPAVCNDLAVLVEEGRGGPEDAAQAVHLFERACTGDVALGCRNLARMLQTGQDAARAREFDAKACRLGLDQSCKILNSQKN